METQSRPPSLAAILGITALLSLAVTGAAVWRMNSGFGAFDAPEMPKTGIPDMRLHLADPWQAVQVPKAVRFDFPTGSEAGSTAYNAQKFWDMNEKRKAHHTGDDFNGIGGMNTDLGDPVFAAADGLVVFAGEPTAEWGNVVIVSHVGPDGQPVQSMYAHLDKIEVAKDSLVARGAKIGTVGTASGHYPAHLHFELRTGNGADIGGGYAMQKANRLDPSETIRKWRNAPAEAPAPSPLSRL